LPPDNRYQRIRLDGGVDLAATSHFSAVVEIGEMSQDEVLLPYSTDDISGTSTITEDGSPLTRLTAQAKVDVTNIVANLTSRPIPKLGLRARYRFYQTDNQMPYTLFERVIDDTVPQSLAGDSYSRPYDVRRSSWDFDGNYRLGSGSTVTAGYKHEVNNYSYREVKETVENTVNLGFRQRITDSVSGKINYRQSDRKADNYDAFQSYKTLFSGLTCPSFSTVDPDPDTGGVTMVDTCFDNHPDARKFYIASRERKQMDLVLMANPLDTLNLGLTVSERDNDYNDTIRFDDTYFGLLTDNSTSITLDVNYDPDTSWLFYAFYTHERLNSIQASRAFTFNVSTAIDSSLNWQAKFDTRIDTLGINTEYNLIYDVLILRFGYTLVNETSNVNFTTGSGLTSEDMPEDVTRRHTLEMEGIYSVRRNLDVNMGLEYETFKVKDWQRDSVEAGGVSIDDVLPLAGPLPAYHALLGYVSLSYTW
jgi:MtrB/PioB family decaheme-associated outer membrane protein